MSLTNEAKRFIRKVVRKLRNSPYVEYVLEEAQLLVMLPKLSDQIRNLEQRLGTLDSQLNTLSGLARQDKRAEARIGEHLVSTEKRLDVLANELKHHMLIVSQAAGEAPEAMAARIVHPEKIAAMREHLMVHVGCGHDLKEDYINVDERELPSVDVVAGPRCLPFSDESIEEIYSVGVIQRFSRFELKKSVLPHWYKLMKPGGRLSAVFLDWDVMLEAHLAGTCSFDKLREHLFGANEINGSFNRTAFTSTSIQELLVESGFTDVCFPFKGGPVSGGYQTQVVAYKETVPR